MILVDNKMELIVNEVLQPTQQIFIIDHQDNHILQLKGLLTNENFDVRIFSSGIEAYSKIISTKSQALLIIGLQLNDMDGFHFSKLIKQHPAHTTQRIIFYNQLEVSQSLVIKALKLGAQDFLTYSLDDEILKLKINSQLNLIEQQKQNNLKSISNQFINKNIELAESISYASAIQKSIFSSEKWIEFNYDKIFVMNTSKHEVGGDFFWIDQLNSKLISICADCTGHGVPGALLSMMSYQIIENIVRDQRIFDPGLILTLLHQRFLTVFGQDSILQHQGMDVSICIYNYETSELEYASAKSRLLIQTGEREVKRLNKDLVSVGDHMSPDFKFNTFRTKITHKTWVFQLTDGIVDQFGGPRNKKYQLTKLEELVEKNLTENKSNLKDIITKDLLNWKGQEEQTDDQTIIGIQLGPIY